MSFLQWSLKKIFRTIQEKFPGICVSLCFIFGVIIFSSLFLQTVHAEATPPSIITYQGKLLDSGVPVDATINMKFLIYDDPNGGSLQYTAGGAIDAPSSIEVPVDQGIFSVNLGGNGTNALVSSIFADHGSLYLEVWIEGNVLSPRKTLTASAYALNSAYLMGYAPFVSSTSAYIPLSNTFGNFVFAGDPQSSSVDGGSVYINPIGAGANETLFGVADNGTEAFRIDKEGDAWFLGNLTATGDTATSSFTNVLVNDGITLGGVKHTSWPAGGGDVTAGGENTFTATNTFTGFTHFEGGVAAPTVMSNIPDFANNAENVFVQGNYAYVALGSGGLQIVDVSNPASPDVLTTDLSAGVYATDVVVAGNYAYLASIGLTVVDISNPSNPSVVYTNGSIGTSLALSGNYVYVAGDLGLSVYNITNPRNPVLIGSTVLDGNSANSIAISGKYAYVTQENMGVLIVDISDPYNLVTVGGVDNGTAHYIAVSQNYAYVSDNVDGVIDVLNITDPEFPAAVGTITLDGTAGEIPQRLFISGDYLYIAVNSADVAIFDISNPLSAVRKGAAGGVVAGDAHGIFVSGNYIYLANNDQGTNILSIAGTKISNAEVGSLNVENIDTRGIAQFNNAVSIRGGLNVGNQGILLNGDFSMFAAPTSTNATNTLRFSHTVLFETSASTTERNAFIFNTKNTLSRNSASNYLLSIRNGGFSTFSIAANGDVHTTGTYYGAAVAVSTPGAPGDLAERVDIAIDDEVEPGDVVVVDPHSTDTYRRSQTPYASEVSGVISTQPSIVVGDGKTEHTAVMAMVGRVPVKVSAENGPIARGDLLITATSTGYAMRYDPTKDMGSHIAGIVGVALESLPEGKKKIMGLVRTGWVSGEYQQSFAQLREELSRLALSQSNYQSTNSVTVSENSDGTITSIHEDVNLNGFSLLSVKSIQGVNKKWQIDEEGRFMSTIDTNDGTKTLYALQTGESQYIFSGQGTLVNGKAHIDFESFVRDIVDTEKPMSINLTLSQKANGIYVSQRDENGFDVEEIDGGVSNAKFDWLVFATRKDVSGVEDTSSNTSVSESDSDSDSDAPKEDTPSVESQSQESSSTPPVEENISSTESTSLPDENLQPPVEVNPPENISE